MNSQLFTKLLELLIIELFPIIRDKCMRDSITALYILEDKVFELLISNRDQRLCFDLLNEIIYCVHRILDATLIDWHGSDKMNFPHSE